jgi:hypothetical protein
MMGKTEFSPSRSHVRSYFYFCALLFLCCLYNHSCISMPSAGDVNIQAPRRSLQLQARGLSYCATGNIWKLRGRSLPPSRSISSRVIFIAVAIILLFVPRLCMHVSCQIRIIFNKQRLMLKNRIEAGAGAGKLLLNYPGMWYAAY